MVHVLIQQQWQQQQQKTVQYMFLIHWLNTNLGRVFKTQWWHTAHSFVEGMDG